MVASDSDSSQDSGESDSGGIDSGGIDSGENDPGEERAMDGLAAVCLLLLYYSRA